MHEISIVNSIMKTLEMEFHENKLADMKAIYLKIGTLSNVEPQLLYNAYTARNHQGTKYHHVQLHIESTVIKIQCEDCNHITHVTNYKFKCESCQKPSKNIIQGKEMLIHKVEFTD